MELNGGLVEKEKNVSICFAWIVVYSPLCGSLLGILYHSSALVYSSAPRTDKLEKNLDEKEKLIG